MRIPALPLLLPLALGLGCLLWATSETGSATSSTNHLGHSLSHPVAALIPTGPSSYPAQDEERTPVIVQFLKYKDQKELKALSKIMPLHRFGERVGVMGERAEKGSHRIGSPMKFYVPVLAKSPKLSKILAESPYGFDKNGERKVKGPHKKKLVSIPGNNIDSFPTDSGTSLRTSVISNYGLSSLCADLEQRRIEVIELRAALKKIKQKTDPEGWNVARVKLVHKWESLILYVENSKLFKEMGSKLRVEYEKGTAKLRDAMAFGRVEAFTEAIEAADAKTVEIAGEDELEFHKLESLHLRITYLIGEEGIDDDEARELLLLGEESIELFRRTNIDPFSAFVEEQEEGDGIIPKAIFHEYFIGPEGPIKRKELFESYYQREVGDDRVFDGMATSAILRNLREDPLYLAFARNQPGALEGWVVHSLGHSLASLHYSRANKQVSLAIPVIQESVAMHLCFEKLGNNNMRCGNFDEGTYEKKELSDKVKKVEIWDPYRDRFFKLSLRAPTFSDCTIVPLNDLNELHLAKGWVAYQFILNQQGVAGHNWLRKAHEAVTSAHTGDRTGLDRNIWRKFTKELFGIDEKSDPLLHFEDDYKEVAESALSEE